MVPTRPPAENWVEPPPSKVIDLAYQIFDERINNLELLTANEGNDFTYTGNLEKELLSTLAVHPMQKEAVESFITNCETGWSVLQKLLFEKKLLQVEYGGKKFYQRNFKQ
jgi:wyosine [tRNA(Phe)-imidazoG37] synthetase (radical SAM superfamily)